MDHTALANELRTRHRHTLTALAVGLAAIVVGIVWWMLLDARVDARVSGGRAIDGVVTDVDSVKIASIASAERVTVRYEVDGHPYATTLMNSWGHSTYRVGDTITMYVSRSDAAEVATRDGLASEGWLMRGPSYCTAGGIAVAVAAAANLVYLRFRRPPS